MSLSLLRCSEPKLGKITPGKFRAFNVAQPFECIVDKMFQVENIFPAFLNNNNNKNNRQIRSEIFESIDIVGRFASTHLNRHEPSRSLCGEKRGGKQTWARLPLYSKNI